MKHLTGAMVLGAFFLAACDGSRNVTKNSGPVFNTAPNENATAMQVMEEPVPEVEPVAAVESEQNRKAVVAAPVPVRSTASSTQPSKMEEAPIDETWDQPTEPLSMQDDMYSEETFKQSQEDWSTEYERKTYNELQLSDDAEDFPIETSGRGETYHEWVNKEL